MRNIKRKNKQKNEQRKQNSLIDTENRIEVAKGKRWGKGEMGKGDQLYCDERKLNFWW